MPDVEHAGFPQLHGEQPVVLPCTGHNVDRILAVVRQGLAGELSAPIFLVGSQVSLADAQAEVADLDYPADTGVLMRTSGSTSGTGSIIALSWASLRASAQATHEALNGPGRWVCDLPLDHIAGFQTLVRSVLAGTEPVHLDLTSALAHDHHGQLTYCSIVPVQLARILASAELTAGARQLVFLVGGAATSPELLARARKAGLNVHTSYGMTETCGGCVYDGYPIGDATITLDAEGQIIISGSMVGTVARRKNEKNETGAWHLFHTRDLGQINPDGSLTVLGRSDDAITTGGLTIIPHLVSQALTRLTTCENVVIGVPDTTWGQAAIAVLDTENTLEPDAEQALRTKLKEELGKGWQPRRILTRADLNLRSWPLKGPGKIDRRAIATALQLYFSHGIS